MVEFPVAGGSGMNHVRVIAYFDSLGRVVSVPSSRNHAARAKIIIDNARYGEHKPIVDVDVVVKSPPGSRRVLPLSSPLRTGREGFPSSGSSPLA